MEEKDPTKIDLLWHEFFTATHLVNKTAKSWDYLVASDPNGFIVPFEVMDMSGNQIVRPDFESQVEEPVYTTQKMMDLYNEHYKNTTIKYDDLLKQFEFDIVVYSETEYFRESSDPLFSYPFTM